MGVPQPRHLPRRNRKLASGMFSYQAIMCPQFGQCERGETTDSSFGNRTMQTFRKLPIKSPKARATKGNTIESAANSGEDGFKSAIPEVAGTRIRFFQPLY